MCFFIHPKQPMPPATCGGKEDGGPHFLKNFRPWTCTLAKTCNLTNGRDKVFDDLRGAGRPLALAGLFAVCSERSGPLEVMASLASLANASSLAIKRLISLACYHSCSILRIQASLLPSAGSSNRSSSLKATCSFFALGAFYPVFILLNATWS